MKRFLIGLVTVTAALGLATCSSSGSAAHPGSAFVLVGALNSTAVTASANFLISGNSCGYYVYRGNGSSPPQVTKSCTLMEDQPNAMGQPHSSVKIGFATDKGQQVLVLKRGNGNTLTAKDVPDIGVFLPNSWAIATPDTNMILNSTAAGSTYSGMAIHVDGASCSMTVTPVADKTPTSTPCGLVFWDSDSVTVAIPGSLVSTQTAKQSWTLQFFKNATAWNLSQPPVGFPATFTEATPAAK